MWSAGQEGFAPRANLQRMQRPVRNTRNAGDVAGTVNDRRSRRAFDETQTTSALTRYANARKVCGRARALLQIIPGGRLLGARKQAQRANLPQKMCVRARKRSRLRRTSTRLRKGGLERQSEKKTCDVWTSRLPSIARHHAGSPINHYITRVGAFLEPRPLLKICGTVFIQLGSIHRAIFWRLGQHWFQTLELE